MNGAGFAGLALVVAALPFIWPAAVAVISAAGGTLFALFCWGGWIGRTVTLSTIALLVASQVLA
jgi:hypothetical protein